ncbi:MAG TPA: hypothetical protein VKH35_10825 [Thermoanaerobaculia bacterium]|nr:hypothetical protein [Thermoanaerobaculia bacterium]
MAQLDISQLGDDSRIWIFGISPALDPSRQARVLEAVDGFLDSWAAHGAPIVSGRALLHGSFLVIAVDRRSETSGCSIDRMFGLLQELERDLEIAILDANRVFVRDDGEAVRALSRADFRKTGSARTVVFDTLAERLVQVRSGEWERSAGSSWHRALL